MNSTLKPRRGEVWRAELDPVRGHEQGGTRPVLIVSDDAFNAGPAALCVAIPITSKNKRIPWHVAITPPAGGLTLPSWVKCEDVRSLSFERLRDRQGNVSETTMDDVKYRLRALLKL